MSDENRGIVNAMVMGMIVGVLTTFLILCAAGQLYADGQRDALNGVWKYQKVTTSDGVVHFIEVTTRPGK